MHLKAKLFLFFLLVTCVSLYAQDSNKLSKVFLRDGTTFNAYVEKQTDGGYKLTTEDGLVLIFREGEISLDQPFRKSAKNAQVKSFAQGKEIIQATNQALSTNIPVQNLKYRDLKKMYSARDYHGYEPGDRYSPVAIGLASFFVPGLGQYITGCQVGWGIVQSVVGGFCLGLGAPLIIDYTPIGAPVLAIWAGMATWSAISASRAAKIMNLYYRDVKNGVAYKFDFAPYIDLTAPVFASNQNNIVSGLSFRVSF